MGVAGKALSHEVTPTPSPASVTFISLYTRRVNKHFLRAGSGGGCGGSLGSSERWSIPEKVSQAGCSGPEMCRILQVRNVVCCQGFFFEKHLPPSFRVVNGGSVCFFWRSGRVEGVGGRGAVY